jgi:hypothetical protein
MARLDPGRLVLEHKKSGTRKVLVRGSLILIEKNTWVVSGWNKAKNAVFICRDDTFKEVRPEDIGCRWTKEAEFII